MQPAGKARRAALFYFSGTGNTWWVARCLGRALREEGFVVSLRNIETVSLEEVRELVLQADLVGVGYPVYGSDVPELMKGFLAGLPRGQVKPALVFCTQYLWSGDGARVGASILGDRDYRIRWSAHIRMPSNLTVNSLVPGMSSADPRVYQAFRQRAARRIAVWPGPWRATGPC